MNCTGGGEGICNERKEGSTIVVLKGGGGGIKKRRKMKDKEDSDRIELG
jgi:hypothetical protein